MSQDIDKEVEEYLSKNFGGFGAKPKETPKPAPVTPSASTPAQQEGKRDLETVITQLQDRLADTVVGSPTHKRILSDLAEAQKALQGSKEPAAEEKPAEGQQDLARVFSAMSGQAEQPPTAEGQRQPVTSAFKLTPEQEQMAAGAAGAYAGAKVAEPLKRTFPPKPLRDLEGLQQYSNQLQAERMMAEARKAELQRFRPAVAANVPMTPGPTSPIGGPPSQLDVIQHATAGREPTSSLSRERGQQFGTKSTFEAGRAQKALLDDMIRRGLVPPTTLDELSLRLGTTVPASGESRVLTTQAGAYDVEQARAAEAERARRTAEAQRRVQELRQTRLAQERTAAALSEASERARAAQTAEAAVASQLAEATPGPLSQVMKTIGPRVMGALAGAGAGASGYEAYQASKEGDPTGAALASLSGLSGIASMFPPATPYALPIGLGIGGIQYMRSQLEPNRPISAEEEAAALRPAFGIYPSSGKRKVRSSS